MFNRLSTKKSRKHLMNDGDEPPDTRLVSHGDVFIKQLAEKQASTQTTLEEQLLLNKEFQKGIEFMSLTKYSAGASSLKQFNENSKKTDDWERMKSLGLTDSDIELYLENRNGDESINRKHKNLNQDILKQRLDRIEEILVKSDVQNTDDEKNNCASRQLMESISSTKPNSIETKLLQFALENTKNHKDKLPHPMDNIKDVETELIKDLSPVNIKKIRKKCRSLARQIQSISNESITPAPQKCTPNSHQLVNDSMWDIKTVNKPENFEIKPSKIYTCKPKKLYTINNREIIEIQSCYNEKLTIDEIKKLPKFENYHPGTPSRILFIKNLANNVTENDLKRAIGDVANHLESIRIMNGKMRGQAFIEFSSVELAQECMDCTNGRMLKNRPVIIQYGRKKL